MSAEDMVGRTIRINGGTTNAKIVAHSSVPAYLIELEDGTRQMRRESDIPAPPVDLPETPTLGSVTWKYDDSKVTQSETALWNLTEDGLCFRSESSSIPVAFVIDFAPIRVLADDATAVPTEALAALRAWWMKADLTDGADEQIGSFFDAADPEVNG